MVKSTFIQIHIQKYFKILILFSSTVFDSHFYFRLHVAEIQKKKCLCFNIWYVAFENLHLTQNSNVFC